MSIGLAEAGADLMLADVNAEGMRETAKQIESNGRRAAPVICDVSEPEQIDAMFERLDREYGRIDILGNVAGEGVLSDPLELTSDAILECMQNVVIGRYHVIRRAASRMLELGKGSIVNIVSIGGLTSLGRNHVPYGMAMGAAAQMTRELSTEWASRGIRVNAIVCSQIVNKSLRDRMDADPQLRKNFLRGLPIGRLGNPDEVKGLAILLASDASSFITGALIPLDGGNLAKNAGGTHPGMPQLG